ncbi:AAA family ATPase [Rhodococcus fascians]|uniref:AAA family ATPase n=1 Tax=Rhodococcoides fascians TaxID=1828 RepID=UPI001C8FAB87|nr:AAA family ATPase [Rhodococcus fascians]MBY4110892.1 ATP-binding protein [Rhodococcus fascians]MBY4115759.1 ATP-binding protein [Rhodococcus fascians]MDJ0424859.1 AAA family ATPase [Rhodococcus fascians]
MADCILTLPSGEALAGVEPVVIIGPNGSGKTRQSRTITANVNIDFINALRNTRVPPELPAMGMDTARANYQSNLTQTRNNHWELASEFDFMLSQLLGQQSTAAMEFTRRYSKDPANAGKPTETPLTHVERLWAEVFPGRELHWRDWKPLVINKSSGIDTEYSGSQMSDGEKAALYLMGRVFSADPGVVVVDEPETHLHSLLAVRLWNSIERARPDIRFVYVTHDLTFALSRQAARFVLASPTAGLRTIVLNGQLPDDVSEALLGSASLSFYASRVVFCEGERSSYDGPLYEAWFNGPDTVVRSVQSCQRVLRCVDALRNSGISSALEAIGIIDADYHSANFGSSLPHGVEMLKVHEVESLLSIPAVVEAVARHMGQTVNPVEYFEELKKTVNETQVRKTIISRWKARIEPFLQGIVSTAGKASSNIEELSRELPNLFDYRNWSFSPEEFLEEEKVLVEGAIRSGNSDEFLRVFPGKQMLPVAAKAVGLSVQPYVDLIIGAFSGTLPPGANLAEDLEDALLRHLPRRHVAVATPAQSL